MLKKGDTLVIIPLNKGFLMTNAQYCDGYWAADKEIKFAQNAENFVACTDIGDVLFFIADLHSVKLSEWLNDVLFDLKYDAGEEKLEVKPSVLIKKKEEKKIMPPNTVVSGASPKNTEKASGAEVGTGKKQTKAKRTIVNTCGNTCKNTSLKNQIPNLPQKEPIGFLCNECGELYETKPEKCAKCNSFTFEDIEKYNVPTTTK